jgi:hypothetical protein
LLLVEVALGLEAERQPHQLVEHLLLLELAVLAVVVELLGEARPAQRNKTEVQVAELVKATQIVV